MEAVQAVLMKPGHRCVHSCMRAVWVAAVRKEDNEEKEEGMDAGEDGKDMVAAVWV